MGLNLILYWKMNNYQKDILLIWKCLYVLDDLFFCYHKRHSFIQNLFQKFSSEIWDFWWPNFQHNTSFYRLGLVAFCFQIIKICQCCGFSFTNFFCFLTATNALTTSWVTFSNISVFFVFPLFWLDFPMVAWWNKLYTCAFQN